MRNERKSPPKHREVSSGKREISQHADEMVHRLGRENSLNIQINSKLKIIRVCLSNDQDLWFAWRHRTFDGRSLFSVILRFVWFTPSSAWPAINASISRRRRLTRMKTLFRITIGPAIYHGNVWLVFAFQLNLGDERQRCIAAKWNAVDRVSRYSFFGAPNGRWMCARWANERVFVCVLSGRVDAIDTFEGSRYFHLPSVITAKINT